MKGHKDDILVAVYTEPALLATASFDGEVNTVQYNTIQYNTIQYNTNNDRLDIALEHHIRDGYSSPSCKDCTVMMMDMVMLSTVV